MLSPGYGRLAVSSPDIIFMVPSSLDLFHIGFLNGPLALFVDGESWGVDEEVISRLVEDAIDSESREVHTMSRSRLVSTT